MSVGILLTSIVILLGSAIVVAGRNLFRAALSLGVVLLGVAVLFLLLGAEFLAFVQILVYVGAILTLVVFAIMLTPQQPRTSPVPTSRQRVPALLASGALFLVLARAVFSLPEPRLHPDHAVTLVHLGRELVTTLVLPFEVVSLIFVAAIVGAIAMAKGKV